VTGIASTCPRPGKASPTRAAATAARAPNGMRKSARNYAESILHVR
jgi:hypothetical protein